MKPIHFLMATLCLDAVGIGIVYPVMPDLLEEVTGGGLETAAIWGGILTAVYAAMQFLFAPLLGALSDRIGRRPVLFVGLGVLVVDYLVFAVAHTIWLLVLLRVIAGIAGATHSTCNAALADLTPPEQRARKFGLLSAAFMVGFVLGPVIGGFLGEIGPRAPFVAAAGLAALNLLLGVLTFPETVRPDAERKPVQANPFASFRTMGRIPGARRLLGVLFLADLAYMSYVAVWAYWGKAAFGWGPWLVGASLAAFGAAAALTQGVLIKHYLRYFGEGGTLRIGLWSSAVFFLVFAALPQTPFGGMLAIVMSFVSSLGEVVFPPLIARLSRLAPEDAQGEMQGVIGSVRSLAAVIGPLAMTWIFALGAGWGYYALAYLVGAVLMAGSIWLLMGDRTGDPAPATPKVAA